VTDNTDSPASNQTHVSIEEYVHLQKKYLESVLTEQSFMIEIKELLDKSIEANARIAELEAALKDIEDDLTVAYMAGLAQGRDEVRAALKGEKENG